MQVQSVNRSVHILAADHSSSKNSHVDALEKEKALLQKEIAKVNQGKDDPQTKEAKLKDLNERLEDLNEQIARSKLDEAKQTAEETQEKVSEKLEEQQAAEEKDVYKGGVVISKSFNHLISAAGNLDDYKKLKSVRTEILNRMRTGGENVNSNGFFSAPGSLLESVERKMLGKVGSISKNIKQAAKSGAKEAEKLRKAKTHDEEEKTTGKINGKSKDRVEDSSEAEEDAKAVSAVKEISAKQVNPSDAAEKKDNIDTYA